MYRKLTPEMLSPYIEIEHRQKEQVINELERELKSLIALEGVVMERNQQILGIEGRYKRVIDEMEVLEHQFKACLGKKGSEISAEAKEISSIRVQYAKAKEEYEMERIKNQPKKEQLILKIRDIQSGLDKLQAIELDNKRIRESNAATSLRLREDRTQKDQRIRENTLLANEVKSLISVLDKKQEQRVSMSESNTIIGSKSQQLIDEINSKKVLLASREKDLEVTLQRLQEVGEENRRMRAKGEKVKENIQLMQYQEQRLEKNIASTNRQNREIAGSIKDLESSVRELDTSIIYEASRKQQLTSSMEVQIQRERVLDEQIRKLQVEKTLAERNSSELERILLTCRSSDEKILTIINRSVLVNKLLDQLSSTK